MSTPLMMPYSKSSLLKQASVMVTRCLTPGLEDYWGYSDAHGNPLYEPGDCHHNISPSREVQSRTGRNHQRKQRDDRTRHHSTERDRRALRKTFCTGE